MSNPHLAEDNKVTRWQPGQSGNPAGKPKGAKHLSTYIQEMMEDETFTADYVEGYTLKKHQGAPIKAIIAVATIKSIAGDPKWADWLAKYGYGSTIKLANDPDNPLLPKQLSEEELLDRLKQVVAGAESGSVGHSLGAGSA